MYDILTDPAMDNGPPILVACNKSDVSTARAPARVKLMLQQEM
jgi:signal recognition particle receptor subunit beta